MATRIRDNRAELARRNEISRGRGFTSRAAERGAIKRADWQTAGYASHAEYQSARRAAKQWSDKHSHKKVSQFSAKFTPQQTKDYLAVYRVEKPVKHNAYIRALARYLHNLDPEMYPPYEDFEDFWDNY